MDLSAIYTLARFNTSTTSTNISDANLLILSNIVYRDLINSIVKRVNEDFFYQEWVTATVANQREYTFPVRTTSVDWLKKVISIGIKYSADDDYYRITNPTKFSNLPRDPSYYESNQNEFKPFFTVADKSLFVYPKPTTGITDWLIIYGVADPKELQTGAVEADIRIPVEYHHVLALGLEPLIYKSRQIDAKEAKANAKYIEEREKMVSELSDRIIRPLESEMPSLINLE